MTLKQHVFTSRIPPAPRAYNQGEEQSFRRILEQSQFEKGFDHATTHQHGGIDEINVTGLAGLLADPQNIVVKKNSVLVGVSNPALNFIEGTNISLTVSSVAGVYSITINSTAGGHTGSGTAGTITKWTGASALGNSIITESGAVITVTGSLTATVDLQGATLKLPHGSAPGSPTDGQCWTTTAGLFVRVNGSTVGPLTANTGTVTGSLTSGTIPKASGSTSLADSQITDDGTNVKVLTGNFYQRVSATDYQVAKVTISTADASGTPPVGTIWLKY